MVGGRAVRWGLLVVPPAFLVVMGWQHRWMSDDGFIHLRVVQQIAGGNGPVTNLGERVEASTSPLWVWLLTAANPVTPVALPWKAVVLGILLTGVGLVAAQAAGRALSGDGGAVVLPIGALVVAVLPPFWDFASSGLETGLCFAWIGASAWWCARRVTADAEPGLRADLAGAALVGLGWLIRPDLLVFTLAFGVVLAAAMRPAGRRRQLGALGAAVALPVVYQVFRMGYYAMVVPNTALAKEASRAQWGLGWRYVLNLMNPYWLWLPIALLLLVVASQTVADWRRGATLPALARAAPAVAGLVHGAYVVRAGGDFMHARLLLPSLFGLVAPITVDARSSLRQRTCAIAPVAATAAVGVWAVACLAFPPSHDEVTHPDIEDERALVQYASGREHPVRFDEHLRDEGTNAEIWLAAEPGQVGVLSRHLRPALLRLDSDLPVRAARVPPAFGAGSYASGLDVYIIDHGSLAHPVGSHLDHLVGTRLGHQKALPVVWQAAGLSDARVVRADDGTVLVSRDDLAAARRARSCGRLGRYLRDVHEPLTPGRFLGNIVDSVPNTLFRVPTDPVEAEEELCG